MKINDGFVSNFGRIVILLITATFLYLVEREFYEIAWGTGVWLGEFSMKWGMAFFASIIICLLILGGEGTILWRPDKFNPAIEFLIKIRARIGFLRWIMAAIFLIAPVWLLQYTSWGIVVSGSYMRVLIWLIAVVFEIFFLTNGKVLFSWPGFLVGLLSSASVLALAVPLQGVTDYPFSLGWSEGNRLWDYSILFGRGLYDYPADHPIPVLLDFGRQFVGGVPFLIPGITIWQARLWVAFTYIFPFLFCGLLAYRLRREKAVLWVLAGLWAFTFLGQGPIHPPLVLSAILVVLAWGQSLWIAVPLIMVASYFAQVSRWTWMFAPGMWAAMLEFSSASLQNNRIAPKDWGRTITVGLAGLFAGYFLPFLIELSRSQLTGGVGGITATDVVGEVSSQPLLWYRLLPNATYGYGILVGLLVATGPLVAILIHLSIRHWQLNIWQKLSIILPLLAFFVVGLIVSVKIGGGGDLHNMDMFLIGLLFAGAVAWRKVGHDWILNGGGMPWGIRIGLALLIAIPGYQPLMALKPLKFTDISRIATLTDITNLNRLDPIPSDEVTDAALKMIRSEMDLAKARGEILFMDQRQLLTFGYIKSPLIPDYDKKVLINNAMSKHVTYFEQFYADLAAHRFSLIITSPLRTPIKDSSYQFGEENNAWVEWVAIPILCYYEEKANLKEVGVQLLVPKEKPVNCSSKLPSGNTP